MKKRIVLCILSLGLSLNTMAQIQPQKVNAKLEKSTLKWYGYYTFYFGGHDGTIAISEGYFEHEDGTLTGGAFTIDMNNITCLDLEDEESKQGLIDHLKDPDFFDVKNHPEAKLVFTNVKYESDTKVYIEANLTIRGITNPINFRAELDKTKRTFITKFKIDRRKWNVNYTSKMRDGAISDAIGFEAELHF